MGLAGRRIKQRIGTDPRNLTWSDDSSKFGAKYLQSLGWTSGSGLGASGQGRTSNLKIHQKLDLMGIGATRQGADDAGWKVGREFDGLLARLNQAQNADSPTVKESENVDDSTKRSRGEAHATDKSEVADKRVKWQGGEGTNEKKKRKLSTEPDGEDAKAAKRRRRREKREKEMGNTDEKKCPDTRDHTEVEEFSTIPASVQSVTVAPRHRAHRARHLASKRLAAASTISMNEILGIAPSRQTQGLSSTPLLVAPRLETDVSVEDSISAMSLMGRSSFSSGFGSGGSKVKTLSSGTSVTKDDLFRKSEKSVAAYFAEKLRMRGVAKEGTGSVE